MEGKPMLEDIPCLHPRNRHAWIGPDKAAGVGAPHRVLCVFCCTLVYVRSGVRSAVVPARWISPDYPAAHSA